MSGAMVATLVAWVLLGAWGVTLVAVCAGAALLAVMTIGPNYCRPRDDNRYD